MAETSPKTSEYIKTHWLIRLRWGAVIGHVSLFLLARYFLELSLADKPFWLLLASITVSNLAAHLLFERVVNFYSTVIPVVVLFDTCILTALLYFYGGHTNPFSTLYVIQVVIAGFLTSTWWTWFIVLVASASFLFLFYFGVPIPELGMHMHPGETMSLHLQGMFVAFVLVASLLAFFMLRLRAALVERDVEIEGLKLRAQNDLRLTGLATLAAGAAHELNTPLATMAVVVHELERELESNRSQSSAFQDILLLKQQIERCRGIIQGMSGRSGELGGELPQRTSLEALIVGIKGRIDSPIERIRFVYSNAEIVTPVDSMISSVCALINNALEASAENQSPIEVCIATDANRVTFTVRDNGSGIDERIIERVGEPFFTTKEPGKGLGLGIFLVKLFARQIGGFVQFYSQVGEGTEASLVVPRIVQCQT